MWRTRARLFEVRQTVGEARQLRIYPNFAALSRYAWLSGDRRLAQMGIKNFVQRGQGTDFRQLADYRRGDPLRHLDVKASMRHRKPVVREYQDERDQCVMFLLDCGRRMRADEASEQQRRASHFDDALDAMMLLAYVALQEGDEVGAMTFGCDPRDRRDYAPRKGMATLNALMNQMHDLQPGPHHSDYLAAAEDMSKRLKRRSLIIILTNFRDEDAPELRPALQLLRRRHLVLLASLRGDRPGRDGRAADPRHRGCGGGGQRPSAVASPPGRLCAGGGAGPAVGGCGAAGPGRHPGEPLSPGQALGAAVKILRRTLS